MRRRACPFVSPAAIRSFGGRCGVVWFVRATCMSYRVQVRCVELQPQLLKAASPLLRRLWGFGSQSMWEVRTAVGTSVVVVVEYYYSTIISYHRCHVIRVDVATTYFPCSGDDDQV